MGSTVSLLDQCLSPSIEVEDVIVTAETDSEIFSVDDIDAVSDTKPETLNAFEKIVQSSDNIDEEQSFYKSKSYFEKEVAIESVKQNESQHLEQLTGHPAIGTEIGMCASILDEALLPSFKIVDVVISSDNSDDSADEYDETDLDTYSADENVIPNSKTFETVQDLDKHAKQVPKSFLKSFKDLLEYFERPLQDKEDKHQMLIRSFLIWLGGLDIPDTETLPLKDLKENDSRSPDEYLNLLKKNLNIYNSIFILLCWAAGIKCFKIKGVYKTGGFDNVASSEWAAVNVNGTWQIVHPFRICRALSGKFPQGLKSKTEDLNTSYVEIFKTSFLDYYINPKPEQFIYEFFPDDTDWQLLPDPITEKQFLKQELYYHTWWDTDLRLTSKRQYRITSTKGKVSITLNGTEHSMNDLFLWYDLSLLDSNGEIIEDTKLLDHDYFQRLVFLVRNCSSWVCKILLPVEGTYRIVFYGGRWNKPLTAICQFSLICKEAYKDPVPLAVDPGCVGLGPGPFAIMGGLISPTYTNGVIQSEMNKTLKLKFRVVYKLPEFFKIKANLHNSNGIVLKGDTTSMADCSISNTIQGREVTIIVNTPDDPGYYMLELLTNKDETKWTSACYYLLVYKALTQVFIERCSQKVRKKILMKVTETGDAHQIMVKIQDCTNKHFHENDIDIQKARGKVALLKTSKKKSLIYSTIFPKESFDSTNIVSQSQYEKRFYDMHKNLRNLTKYLRNMYCSSSKSSQSLDTRSLFPEEKYVIRMVLILFGKPVDEEEIFVQLIDDIVKELGQTGLVLEIENVRKTATIPIRFTSEQIKFISKAAARVYNTVQDIVDWMLKSS